MIFHVKSRGAEKQLHDLSVDRRPGGKADRQYREAVMDENEIKTRDETQGDDPDYLGCRFLLCMAILSVGIGALAGWVLADK
tara:strand:+ start:298 stop:543 length:246 start_codon:yes stop_codon:yes gene_type:complete